MMASTRTLKEGFVGEAISGIDAEFTADGAQARMTNSTASSSVG
jgi:hypothetical protein